jgi:hypothetical protein
MARIPRRAGRPKAPERRKFLRSDVAVFRREASPIVSFQRIAPGTVRKIAPSRL